MNNPFSLLTLFALLPLLLFSAEQTPKVVYSPTEIYFLLDNLGEGIDGEVYSAVTPSGDFFAIKIYKNPDWRDFDTDLEREFEIGQDLDHPNIIKSIDYFSVAYPKDVIQYLILELVEGHTLYSFPKSSLTKEEVFHACRQLLDALKHAFSEEMVHLDLHSKNLMLKSRGLDLMVIDLASFTTCEELNSYSYSYSTTQTSAKNQKIAQFFARKPELLKKTACYASSHTAIKSINQGFDPFFLNFYFDDIGDNCIKIILRCHMSRTERISLRTKIKQLAWEYEEDVFEGIEKPFLFYLKKLRELFTFEDVPVTPLQSMIDKNGTE